MHTTQSQSTHLLLPVLPKVYPISSSSSSSSHCLLSIALFSCRLPFTVIIHHFQLSSHSYSGSSNLSISQIYSWISLCLKRQYRQSFEKSRQAKWYWFCPKSHYSGKFIELCCNYQNWVRYWYCCSQSLLVM